MFAYILKRVLLMLPTLLGVLLLTFVVIQLLPGGPVEQYMAEAKAGVGGGGAEGGGLSYRGAQGVDPKRLEQIKALYGFDKPASQRFIDMLWRYARFDLGESFYHHQSVGSLILSKLPVSMSLGLSSFLLTYLCCIPLGIAKAVRHGSTFDLLSSTVILVGYAIPGFVLGVALLVLFGGGSFLQWFPLRGLTSDDWATLSPLGKALDYLWHLVLPVTASVVGSLAVMTLLTKITFLE